MNPGPPVQLFPPSIANLSWGLLIFRVHIYSSLF
uniref:Uncharacterized protein n=1 Tax=Rhizophora mucronata TaxID=61149 RepID=A0A2P2P5J6_RHIMU